MSKIASVSATIRRIDDSLSIADILSDPTFAFDVVKATLDGDHPVVVNRVSDRIYYILNGNGHVLVGNEVHQVSDEDIVKIRKGTPHTIRGKLAYLIITSPPFDPSNEEIVG